MEHKTGERLGRGRRRLEAITCTSSGMQLAMLSDDVKKASRAREAIVVALRVILCNFSSFQSRI